jgi:hypothetical protein
MKKFETPIKVTAKTGYAFGTFPKTSIMGNAGDVFEVVAETKKYWITTNTRNNKLPKYITE